MKVLCFTNSSYNYNKTQNSYFGGGWIDSLLYLLENEPTVELAVSFFHEKDNQKTHTGDITYYPIYKVPRRKNPFKTVIGDWLAKIENPDVSKSLIEVIEDYKPDVIQVFGTEGVFSCIQKHTNIPVLVHLQGLLNPYYNTYYPINQSKWNFIFDINYLKSNILGKGPSFTAKRFHKMALREAKNFETLKFVSGRTEWDSIVAKISNPNIEYFHIEEVLRPIFYKDNLLEKKKENKKEIQIVSTISPTIYKGIDVILKTAKLLKSQKSINFNWKIIGLESNNTFVKHFEKNLNISHKEVNVDFLGIKKSEDFINELLNSDLYIHPSYIDNSPNSVCEAQILGLPVIACNVGGLSTIIDHKKTGLLVPSNGIYEIANYIQEYTKNPKIFNELGIQGREKALIRHDKDEILKNLIEVYKIISKK
ncbi:glycosyltransferase [Cellulophaga sp. Z1A5H]|uniref:glycosyltransferase n=1 Tax=Cellulophaga sp. Z1A5H TaxID=2687291 RepID=UPI0013FD170D|nr:glycosyltransferase [Cellulophaga sp. Z1A5H]